MATNTSSAQAAGHQDWRVLNVVAFSVFVASAIAYHSYFVWRYRSRPLSLSLGINLAERNTWVLRYLATKNAELTVVHTIRNMIISTTFFSSSSLLVSWGLLRPVVSGAVLHASHADDPWQVHSVLDYVVEFGNPKTLVLSGLFFAAFLCFAVAVRHFNHVSFLLSSYPNKDPDRDTQTPDEFLFCAHRWDPHVKDSVVRLMMRATLMYHVGLRCFYTFVPLGMWLLGPFSLFVGTAFYLAILAYNDFISMSH